MGWFAPARGPRLNGRRYGGRAPTRSQLLVVGPDREGVWRGATNFRGTCALVFFSCPPRLLSFVSLELYATAGTAALHHSEPQTELPGGDSLPWICLLFSISRHTTLVLGRITRMPVDHLRHPCQRAAPVLRGVGRGSMRLTLHCASQRLLSGESTIGWENSFPVCRDSPWRRRVALNRHSS